MSPPPITTSPYRFLPSSSNSKTHNSALNSTPQSLRLPSQEFRTPIQQPSQPQQQFASTPRFSFSLTGFGEESRRNVPAKRQIRHTPHVAPKEDIEEEEYHERSTQREGGVGRGNVRQAQSSSSPLALTSLGRLLHESTPQLRQPSGPPKEEIEEAACENEAIIEPYETIFDAVLNHEIRSSFQIELALSPIRKRRRFKSPTEPSMYPEAITISPSPSPSPSIPNPLTQGLSDDELHTPPPSVYRTNTAHPHFLSPNTEIVSPFTSISSFPRFILPTPSSPPLSLPGLPQFSPPRRNQKLVPGGLASTLRDLVVQTSLRNQQSQIRQGGARSTIATREGSRAKGESGRSWDFLIPVMEVRRAAEIGIGISLVREQAPNDDEGMRGTKGWVLIGAGAAGNDNPSQTDVRLQVGSLIGMRQPVWNIEVLGENWWVGVEWGVIS